MSCGCNGGGIYTPWYCGPINQPAPGCSSAPPTACAALPVAASPPSLVVQDQASCFGQVAPPSGNSITYYTPTGKITWADGSAAHPISLPVQNQIGGSIYNLLGQDVNDNFKAIFPDAAPAEPEILLSGTGGNGWTPTPRSQQFGAGLGIPYRPQASPNLITFLNGSGAAVGSVLALNSNLDPAYVASSVVTGSPTINLGIIAGGSVAAITADLISLYTASNAIYTLSSIAVNALVASSGVNGIDSGIVATNTIYALYVIYNPTTFVTASIFSTNFAAPVLPTGYTAYRKVGFVSTQSSLIQFNKSSQSANVCTSGLAYATELFPVGTTIVPNATSFTATNIDNFPTTLATQFSEVLVCLQSSSTSSSYTSQISSVVDFTVASSAPIEFNIQAGPSGQYQANRFTDQRWVPNNKSSGFSLKETIVASLSNAGAYGTGGVYHQIQGYKWNFI